MAEKCREKAIIFTGYAASKAALEIMEGQKETLRTRYPVDYLAKGLGALRGDMEACADPEAETRLAAGAEGVFGALWKLGEELSCGLEVNLMQIPIRQITIEMCDLVDINPYEADSTGCGLIVTDSPRCILDTFAQTGVPAAVIGYTTGGNDRVVVNGEIRRFLTPVR